MRGARLLALPAVLLALCGCEAFDDTPPEGDARGPLEVFSASSAAYSNPVHGSDFPDPFVLRHGARFYAYATQKDARGIQVMESADLVAWTHRGTCLLPPWSRDHLWAPEVVERGGLFYMTYSALNPKTGRHDLGIATAAAPEGPFEHRAVLVRAGVGQAGVIDGTIFTDTDGASYLLYSREAPRAIVLTGLNDDWLSVTSERTELLHADQKWEKGVAEAPTLVLRDGVYHLFYSGGPFQGSKNRETYAVGHAASRSVRGPFVKDAARVLETVKRRVYGPGHQCVLRLDSGEDWMIYHGWDNRDEPYYGSNPAGRTLRLDRLHFDGVRVWVNGPSTGARARPDVGGARGAAGP